MPRKLPALAPLVAILVTACAYDGHFEDCAVRCATDGAACPDGLSCGGEGLCRVPGVLAACAPVSDAPGGDAPPAVAPPSCAALAPTCGPSGGDDCCSTAAPIPGGTFYRSYDVAGDGMFPDTSYPATVSAFRLDKYEVTVGRFRAFVAAGMGTQVNPPPGDVGARMLNGSADQGGWDPSWDQDLAADTTALVAAVKCTATWQSWTDTPGANEELPMNCITWYEAFAFCAWDGGFLPTEAEWNFAASGGSEQRAYPWSNPAGSTTIDCSYANYEAAGSASTCVDPGTGGVNRVGDESPKGDGAFGQADLGGNVWEWNLDWYAAYATTTCEGCADLSPTAGRVIRGGSYNFSAIDLRAADRNASDPYARYADFGARCARTL